MICPMGYESQTISKISTSEKMGIFARLGKEHDEVMDIPGSGRSQKPYKGMYDVENMKRWEGVERKLMTISCSTLCIEFPHNYSPTIFTILSSPVWHPLHPTVRSAVC